MNRVSYGLRMVRFAFLEFLRDGLAAFFSIVFPLAFAVFFGLVAQYQAAPRFKLSVANQDQTPRSAELMAYLRNLPGVALEERDQPEPAGAHLTIPRGAFVSGGPPLVVSGPPAAAYLTLPLEAARARLSEAPTPFTFVLRTQKADAATNPFLFMLPGLMALAIVSIGILGTASPLHRARVTNALRHLATTCLTPASFVWSQALVKLVVCVVQVALLLGVGILLFDIPVPSRLGALLGITVLGAAMLIGLGFALAAVVPRGAAQLIVLTNFVLTFLGHIFWDVSTVPFLSSLVNLMPTTYLADALRQLTLDSPGLHALGTNVIVMCLVALVALAATGRWFRFVVRN